jgi:hypothetical protein
MPDNVKDHARPTGLGGGAAGSEYEGQVSGAPRKEENVAADLERQRTGDLAGLEKSDKAHRLSTTSRTEVDDLVAREGENGMVARTPEQMALYDELSRIPGRSREEPSKEPGTARDHAAGTED